jgi:undecaprenyl-diphosphatase
MAPSFFTGIVLAMETGKTKLQALQALPVMKRLDALEVALCQPANDLARRPVVRGVFAVVSRLGDGLIWYVLMVAFPLAFGLAGLALTAQMALGGLLGLVTYKRLKQHLIRERPFASHPSIHCAVAPLDRYSFPSGHTLHAVLFGALILAAFPGLYPVLLPFVAMIALSRVILGLHYPSDVVVGALIGLAIAELTRSVLPLTAFAPAA